MKRVLLCIALVMLSALACAQTYTYKMVYSMQPKKNLQQPRNSMLILNGKGYGSVGGGIYQAQSSGVGLINNCCITNGAFVADSKGNLYGNGTDPGGHEGGVFSISSQTFHFTKLYEFPRGQTGNTSLIFDSSGDLWGTAGGGANLCQFGTGCGVVFELVNNQGKWTEQTIYNFTGPPDGFEPSAPLVFDPASGTYYGTTYYGGSGCLAPGCGTIFQLTPNGDGTWLESVIHDFSGTDGSLPLAGLVLDSQGNLYGTASTGGVHDVGVVYEISAGQFVILHNFGESGDGGGPAAPLTFDLYGNLWGTTQYGGAEQDHGTLFYLSPIGNGWQYTLFHGFANNITDGGAPTSGVTLDGQGNLWGTTPEGGDALKGTIFEVEVTK